MEKLHYDYVYKHLITQLKGDSIRARLIGKEYDTWVVFYELAIRFLKKGFIFNPDLLNSVAPTNLFPDDSDILEPLIVTETLIVLDKLTLRELTAEGGVESYLQEKFVKLFPPNKYHFKRKKRDYLSPVYCYDNNNILSGIILPCKYQKNK